MLKNNKGITIIALVVTILALIILASISTYSGVSTVRMSKFYNAVSQMKVMQTVVNSMYEDYINGDESVKKDIEEYGSSLQESGKKEAAEKAFNSVQNNKLNGEDIGSISDYRYYSVDYIKNTLDVDAVKYDFIVNVKTRTVILLNGVKQDDKMYYSLCEIKDEQYNVQYNEN